MVLVEETRYPTQNVWEFDVGKLVVLGVFFDVDLLVSIEKRSK